LLVVVAVFWVVVVEVGVSWQQPIGLSFIGR